MKLTSYRSTCTVKGPGPLNSNLTFRSMSISPANFFKYFVPKNWQGGDES